MDSDLQGPHKETLYKLTIDKHHAQDKHNNIYMHAHHSDSMRACICESGGWKVTSRCKLGIKPTSVLCASSCCECTRGTPLSHASPGEHPPECRERTTYSLSDSEETRPQDLTLTLEHTEIHRRIDLQSQRRNKANASEDTKLGHHARHAHMTSPGSCSGQGDTSGIQDHNDSRGNSRVIEINTKYSD